MIFTVDINIIKMSVNIRQYTITKCDEDYTISNPEGAVNKIEMFQMEGRNLVIRMESVNDIVFLNLTKLEKRELGLIAILN
jgi:hypothetical protein